MTYRFASTQANPGEYHWGFRGLGMPGSNLAHGGDYDGLLYAALNGAPDVSKEYKFILSEIPAGMTNLQEDGGFDFSGSTSLALNIDVYEDESLLGTRTVSILVDGVPVNPGGGGGTPDTIAPVMVGSATKASITTTGYTLNWQAATDAVGTVAYEVSTDGGGTYTNVGNVLTYTVTGKQSGTVYANRIRAVDAAGNHSITPLSITATTLVLDGDVTVANTNMLELDLDMNVVKLTDSTVNLGFVKYGNQYVKTKDPDADIYVGVDMASQLENFGNGITLVDVEGLVTGITLSEAAHIQGTHLIAKVSGGDVEDPEPAVLTFQYTLSNGDVDNISLHFNIVEK